MSDHSSQSSQNPIHVMLVDDSAVVRGFIGRILESDPEIKIVASVANGEQGISSAARHHPDIIILDIEMPVMDGIEALPKILAASPGVRVLMCSTLTAKNADVSLRALTLGATDYITKPSNSFDIYSAENFKTEILARVKTLGRRADTETLNRPSRQDSNSLQKGTFSGGLNSALKSQTAYSLKPHPAGEMFRPSVIAIGSSTGGPQALFKVLGHLKNLGVPLILTQHMPPTFTKILAQHITQHTGLQAHEGQNGMRVENNTLYVAPGGFHMTFVRRAGFVEIMLDQGPPENFCKPSVDPMMRSAMEIWGNKILGVILTGMGSDGLPSCKKLVEAGGRVIAQNQETSVVWGMPGAMATNGLCTAVLPLQEIGPWVRQALGKA